MSSRTISTAVALAAAILTGHVTDRTTGQPIAGVRVDARGPMHAHATTDERGAYTLRGLRSGTYTLTLSSDDVPPVRDRVRVTSGTTKENVVVCSTTLDYSCAPGGDGQGR